MKAHDLEAPRGALAAFVGLPRRAKIDGDQLEAVLREVLDLRVEVRNADAERENSLFLIDVGGRSYTAMSMPFGVPVGDLVSALQTAYGWSTARQTVEQSEAHIVIAPLSAALGHGNVVAQAADLTKIVSAVTTVSDALFVYWAAGDVISDPGKFRRSSAEMTSRNAPPILSWIQFRLIPGKAVGRPGKLGMLTTGLRPFVGYELRVEPFASAAVEAAKLTVRLAEYLVRQGDVISEGDSSEIDGLGRVEFHFGSVPQIEGAVLLAQLVRAAG